MIECDDGEQPASPTPTPIRAISRCQKFVASPDSAVMALHTVERYRDQIAAIAAIGDPRDRHAERIA